MLDSEEHSVILQVKVIFLLLQFLTFKPFIDKIAPLCLLYSLFVIESRLDTLLQILFFLLFQLQEVIV